MQPIQTIKTYQHPFFVFIGMAIYAVCICFMAINSQSITNPNYIMGILGAFIITAFLPLGAFCNCIFFTVPFTSVLKLPIETFSFITLMQLLLIIRAIGFKQNIYLNSYIKIVIASTLTQFFPIMVFGQTFNGIILLVFNLLTFYCVYKLVEQSELSINHAYLSFSIGVLLAGFIAIPYNIYVTDMHEDRFCGLWTDPNFWGMFCLIGIVTSLLYGFKKPLLFIFLLPIILGLAYQGFLTKSRTFIIVCSLMAIVISWSYLKKMRRGSVLVIVMLLVGIYYALPYAIEIFSERGLDENDVTNGRAENTVMIFDFMQDHLDAILFGFGYNNTLNVMQTLSFGHGASHNSYADLFVEFGLIVDVVLLIMMVKHSKYIKALLHNLNSLPGIVFCIILFYMGSLSMLKYALLFLFIGTFAGTYKSTIKYK